MKKFSKQTTNICKGIAILMMYVHHLFYSANTLGMEQVNWWGLSEARWIEIAGFCKICVSIFVFLTAYGTEIGFMSEGINYKKIFARYERLMFGVLVIYVDSQIISYFTPRTRVMVYGGDLVKRIFYSFLDAFGLAEALGTPKYNATWWYLSYAILLIFLMPLISKLTEKLKYGVIPFAILFPRLCGFDMTSTFWYYLLPLVLGSLFAQEHVLEKILDNCQKVNGHLGYWAGLILIPVFLQACFFVRKNYGYASIIDGCAAAAICYYVYAYISRIRIMSSALAFLGTYSMNMFLIHTYIKNYWCNEFTYSFRYPELILLMLVLDTLMISILVEVEKKGIQWIWCNICRKRIVVKEAVNQERSVGKEESNHRKNQ